MFKAPCNGCNDRHKNCHSNCEEYKEYTEDIKRLKEKKRNYREGQTDDYFVDKHSKFKWGKK